MDADEGFFDRPSVSPESRISSPPPPALILSM
jgi:hypothetical protein